jgi:hypothetical protein
LTDSLVILELRTVLVQQTFREILRQRFPDAYYPVDISRDADDGDRIVHVRRVLSSFEIEEDVCLLIHSAAAASHGNRAANAPSEGEAGHGAASSYL